MQLFEIRNRYRTGDLSVYPLIVSSDAAHVGKVKIVSAKKQGKWWEVSHYGEPPMNTWDDVFQFLEKEISFLKKLNALSYISKEEVKDFYEELNPPSILINVPEQDSEENLILNQSGVSHLWNFIDNSDDSPRFEKGYWEPILQAWENSYAKMVDDFNQSLFVEL